MKKIIDGLKKSNNKNIEIDYKHKENILLRWPYFRNPVMFLVNCFIMKILKYFPLTLKNPLYRLFLRMKIGKNVGISPEVEFDCFCPDLITIEDNVIIGLKVNMLTHEFTKDKIRFGKVLLKKGCLIGAFTNIQCGVIVGKNAVVAMNSLVNKDIPDNEMWGGVPAKFIKKVE